MVHHPNETVVIDTNYPKIKPDHDYQLPELAKRMHGCVHCEWRGTTLCPFKFKKGHGAKLSKNMHHNGICQERANFLKNMVPTTKQIISYREWVMGYNNSMAQLELNNDYKNMMLLDMKIAELEHKLDNPDEDIYGENNDLGRDLFRAKKERNQIREKFESMYKTITAVHDRTIDRETKKEINVNVNTLSIDDINRILMTPDDVLEAEWRESRVKQGLPLDDLDDSKSLRESQRKKGILIEEQE